MKVSIFKEIRSVTPIKNISIDKALEIIRKGDIKSKISDLRCEMNEDKQKEIKNSLPYITVCGTFDVRAKGKIIKSSGLSCLDFDYIDNLVELKEKVNKDPYTFASFVSPRGNGLKVLVKIPKVSNDEDYKDYYHELRKHYNQYAETDLSTTDISRATFLSYDSELFTNVDSELFTDKYNRPIKAITEVTNVPLTDQDEIANRLEKWFKKNHNTGTNRNNNLHKLARAFNGFGVDKSICETYCFRYEQSDFKEKEIQALINSAYNYTEEFNTQAFEDEKKVKVIKNHVIAGKEINSLKGVKDELLSKEVKKHKEDLKEDEFWYFTDKGVIKLATFRFLRYLEYNNVSKYYPGDNGYVFLKKDGNFISQYNEDRIKDFTLEDLRNRGEIDAFEMMANRTNIFNSNFLNMVKTSNIEIQKDTKDESYIYYKNTAVKVKKDSFELMPYDSLSGLVWEDQIIDRNLVLAEESDGEFKTFIWKISGENKERYYTFKSVLGYLLHSYQNEGKPKVIIFNDEMISDSPNGGSGKGLIHKAISYIKNLSTINGKGFDPSKQFAYQTVNPDTQVLLFDDIDKNFKFENLFSLITEGLIIEKKGKDAVKIPFNDSPKISITTNYTVKGEGGSHLRRIFEVEMSSHFNDKHTPEDEFGHLLFSEWTPEEWAKFDNYMLRCIQCYLKNGLIESKTVNLELRKLRNDTNKDFLEFMDAIDFEGQRYFKAELKDAFVAEYDDYKWSKWFTTTLFNKWIEKYCDFNGLVFEKGQSNGSRFISIDKVPF
jgi:hypothetical protein